MPTRPKGSRAWNSTCKPHIAGMEWLLAIGVFIGLMALLPAVLRRSRAAMREEGSPLLALGFVMRSIFDSRRAEAVEEARPLDEAAGDRQDENGGPAS